MKKRYLSVLASLLLGAAALFTTACEEAINKAEELPTVVGADVWANTEVKIAEGVIDVAFPAAANTRVSGLEAGISAVNSGGKVIVTFTNHKRADGSTVNGVVEVSHTGEYALPLLKLFPKVKTYTFKNFKVEPKLGSIVLNGSRTYTWKSGTLLEGRLVVEEVTAPGFTVTTGGKTYQTESTWTATFVVEGGTKIASAFSVYGESKGTTPSNLSYTSTVSAATPVVFNSCNKVPEPVSGVREFNLQGIRASVNFGNGECDGKFETSLFQ